jgi:hypothetical protein
MKKKGEVKEMEEADRNVSVSPSKDAPIFRRRKLLLNSQEYYIKAWPLPINKHKRKK